MKHHLSRRRGLLVLALVLALAVALALALAAPPTLDEDECDAPVARWQSRAAVRQLATKEGWQLERVKIDDGCYEIRGMDAQGRGFEAKLNPETLKVLKMKQRDHQPRREHDRND